VLILLPPSESKSSGTDSKGLNLASLSFADDLDIRRREVLERYGSEIWQEPVGNAINIYAGVLYKALDFHSLSNLTKRRAETELLISSALFGVLRPFDLIPRYKAKMRGADWSDVLPGVLNDIEQELIVDCRSSTYATSWRPDPALTVAIRVFQVKNDERSVITHMSKKYRGELTRALLQFKAPKNGEELLEVARTHFDAELSAFDGVHARNLDLLISANSSS
jgi:cytoplasmic iron level regulating protein YaaA (DUF328/UPF0246 family)